MPDLPFPINAKSFTELLNQSQKLWDDMYENRIGGANVGDVFEIGDDDIFSVKLSTTGGLEKSSSQLQVKIDAAGGLQTGTDGVAAKCKANGGITVDSNGFSLEQQAHIADAATITSFTVSAGADTINLADTNTKLGTLVTEVNALKTKINAIIKTLEDMHATATS